MKEIVDSIADSIVDSIADSESVSHVLFLVFSPQKRRHGSCRVEHGGDHGNLGYNELRHDSGACHECFVKKA